MPETCWTCANAIATHIEFRDALGENEHTCDTCHKEEYPEQYCWEVKCDGCGRKCGKEECPFDTGYDINENFICDDCPIDSDSD